MTDFDSLLPPRLTPPPALPHRGGPAVIKAAAARRRKQKATKAISAGSVASLAVAGLFVLRPPPATHGVTVEPTATHPPSTPGTARVHDPGPRNVDGGTTTRTTAPPTRSSPTPTPTSLPSPTASPSVTIIDDRPIDGPEPADEPYTPILRRFVPDPDPGNDCFMQTSANSPGAVHCARTIAPPSVRSGQPVTFVFQACAYGGRDQVLRFAGEAEARLFVLRDGADASSWSTRHAPGGAPHDLLIPAGQCAEYTIHWNGLGADGEPLPPGTYLAAADLIDNGGPTEISDDTFVVT